MKISMRKVSVVGEDRSERVMSSILSAQVAIVVVIAAARNTAISFGK